MSDLAPLAEASRPPMVLVVDDEILIRMYLAEELRGAGYAVVEASNGDEARLLLSNIREIGVVLTDIRMPAHDDGLVLARWIRLERPEVKIVLISSIAGDAKAGDADAAFSKPVNMHALLTRLSGWLLN